MLEGSGSVSLTNGSGSEVQKHTDPTGPDPQYCLKLCVYLNAVSFAAKRALISSRRAVEAAGSGFCDVLVRIRSTRSRSMSTVPVLRSSNTSCLASYRLNKVLNSLFPDLLSFRVAGFRIQACASKK